MGGVPLRSKFFLLVLPLIGTLAGCVSEPVAPVSTNLIVTRAGDSSQIQWQSSPGKTYTVLYSDGLSTGAKWTVLPGGAHIQGTGGPIRLEDHPPAGQPRYYDLHIDYGK